MSGYRVDFTAKASSETVGLPPRAFKALIEALGRVRHDPWGQTSEQGSGGPAYRWGMFGEDGMFLAYIDEDTSIVRVYGLTWIE
ncbi:hypothetical protein [Nocardiopsis baichengensis]|uniref:hypothetical protein n=1 Tax=Nocardiopsis baichengensis TaxID=280240 RepID=UPI00034BE1FA|nr:hypothetical protein [Nocardiopsis baichengensis]